MKKYLLLLFAFLFLMGEILVAQKIEPPAFQYFRTIQNASGTFTGIQFWDSITNKVIKTIKLYEESPFAHLKETKIATGVGCETPIYKMDVSYVLKHKLFPLQGHPLDLYEVKEMSMVSEYWISRNSRDYLAVMFTASYQAYYEGNYYPDKIFLTESTIHVYDKKGNLLHQIPNIPLDGSLIEVTEDGRFVCFNTGLEYGEGRVSNIPLGFAIYDAQKKELVYRDTTEFTSTSLSGGGYYVVYRGYDETRGQIREYIDPADKMIYSIDIDVKNLGRTKYVTKEKVVLYHPEKKLWTELYFSKDFKITKI
jgi:hypothetical protein